MHRPDLRKWLDLVAFGTVCDVVPLKGVNRLFVKSGLKQALTNQNVGLKALSQISKIHEQITSYHLGYILGPRINAGGRVGKSDLGMRLLSTFDEVEAAMIANELEELNILRRTIESQVLEEALEQAQKDIDAGNPFILVQGENWHQGVVGIVAGRLKERFNLPSFVLSVEGNACPRGKIYASNEVICPVRVLTTTIKTQSGKMLPVKSNKPIKKSDIFDAMSKINGVMVQTPIKIGEIVIANLYEGIDIIACADVE